MKPEHALVALIGYLAALGVVLSFLDARGIAEPPSLQIGSTLGLAALTFAWYWSDSEARRYKRSPFLSIAVAALGFIAVPYYLFRSRHKGERLMAIGRFLGFGLLLMAVIIAGSYSGFLLGSHI
jgi:hypothetical protein